MKFLKKLLAVMMVLALMVMFCLSARAQSGFDYFGVPRTLVIAPPFQMSATNATYTNGPIDLRLFEGPVSLLITSFTNQGGALTVTPYTSPDQTNLTSMGSYAIGVSNVVFYTNGYYGGTGIISTNIWLLPGTLTTPTAATAGFATPYLNPAPFTNTGALTVTGKGIYSIGFNSSDTPRYFYLVWTPTGANSNDVASAVLIGRTHGEVK